MPEKFIKFEGIVKNPKFSDTEVILEFQELEDFFSSKRLWEIAHEIVFNHRPALFSLLVRRL